MAWEKIKVEVHAGDGGHEEGRDESERKRKTWKENINEVREKIKIVFNIDEIKLHNYPWW